MSSFIVELNFFTDVLETSYFTVDTVELTMIDLFGALRKLVKFKQTSIDTDNNVFRLHYKMTVIILVACAALVTSKQHFGEPISCMSPAKDVLSEKPLNMYCWIFATFTVKRHLQDNSLSVQPGVGNYIENEDVILYHKYYQWVSVVLLLQSLFFYIPRYLWKGWEGGLLRMMALDLDNLFNDAWSPDRRKKTIHFLETTRGSHNIYAYRFAACEILNLINVIGQIFFLDYFLGGEFSSYGVKVIKYGSIYDMDDPMNRVFPKVTKCTFKYFGPSGGKQIADALCVLSLNVVNEKIFVVLWFWFILLAIISLLAVIFRIFYIAFWQVRLVVLRGQLRRMDNSIIHSVIRNYDASDCFLLYQLGKSVNPMVFRDIMENLSMESESSLLKTNK